MDLGTSVGVSLGELLLGGRELVPQPLVVVHEGLELRAERIHGATMGFGTKSRFRPMKLFILRYAVPSLYV